MDVQAETFVLRILDRTLMLSGDESTSTLAAACCISESHCRSKSTILLVGLLGEDWEYAPLYSATP